MCRKEIIGRHHWRIMLDFLILCYVSNAQYFHNYADQEVSVMLIFMLKYMASENVQKLLFMSSEPTQRRGFSALWWLGRLIHGKLQLFHCTFPFGILPLHSFICSG